MYPSESKYATRRGAYRDKIYAVRDLSRLPACDAEELIMRLYGPDERFVQGFYRYRVDVLGHAEDVALASALQEGAAYAADMIENLGDPYMRAIGFEEDGCFRPVGIYGFRPLEAHQAGQKVIKTLHENELGNRYPGPLALTHSLSVINGERNLGILRYGFLLVALEAVELGYEHIFFFMSDHRLKRIYKRFGLEFPDELHFSDSKRLIGSYTIGPTQRRQICEAIDNYSLAFDHPSLLASA